MPDYSILDFEFPQDEFHPFDVALRADSQLSPIWNPFAGEPGWKIFSTESDPSVRGFLEATWAAGNGGNMDYRYTTWLGIYRRMFELGWLYYTGSENLSALGGTLSFAGHGVLCTPQVLVSPDHISRLSQTLSIYMTRPADGYADAWLQHLRGIRESALNSAPSVRPAHVNPEIERQVQFFFRKSEPYVPLWKLPRP